MATTGEHGIIIPDPSTAGADVNRVRDLALQVEAGLADVEAAASTYVLGQTYTRTQVDARLTDLGSRTGGVPIFGSQAEAQAWELVNPGRVALWWDSGYTPPVTLETTFSTDAADLYATALEGRPWTKGLMGAFGTPAAEMAMSVSGGVAVHGAGQGAGAVLALGSPNMVLEVDYDLTGGTPGAARQARVFGRGNPSYAIPAGRPDMPVQVAVRYDGQVLLDPWVDPVDEVYRGFVMGTGAPVTGTLSLTLVGSQAVVKVNGSQVGPSFTLAGPQLSGTSGGFGSYQGGKVSRFKVTG